MILAFDPGAKTMGWALLGGPVGVEKKYFELMGCGLLRFDSLLRAGLCAKDLRDELIKKWNIFSEMKGLRFGSFSPEIIIEEPQSYFERHLQKGSQDDLIRIALVGGIVVGVFDAVSVQAVKPREWKGSVPKEVHQPRILKRLTPFEKELVEDVKPASLRHNVVDSVGIALWAAGRL